MLKSPFFSLQPTERGRDRGFRHNKIHGSCVNKIKEHTVFLLTVILNILLSSRTPRQAMGRKQKCQRRTRNGGQALHPSLKMGFEITTEEVLQGKKASSSRLHLLQA